MRKQNCCPHMGPNAEGRYRATNETSLLGYKGNMYSLKTCCEMCANAMRENSSTFDKDYLPHIVKKNGKTYLQLSNRVTKVPIQYLPLKEN